MQLFVRKWAALSPRLDKRQAEGTDRRHIQPSRMGGDSYTGPSFLAYDKSKKDTLALDAKDGTLGRNGDPEIHGNGSKSGGRFIWRVTSGSQDDVPILSRRRRGRGETSRPSSHRPGR